QEAHFLFLGYSMRDWNLRVILRRIIARQTLDYKWWSVQLEPDVIEKEFWRTRNVDIHDVALEDYVRGLEHILQRLPPAPRRPCPPPRPKRAFACHLRPGGRRSPTARIAGWCPSQRRTPHSSTVATTSGRSSRRTCGRRV